MAAVPLALHNTQYIAEEPFSYTLARPIRAGGEKDRIASFTGRLARTVVRATCMRHDLFGGVQGSEEMFQIARRFTKFASARE